jgi:hypothetical protein
MALLQWKNVTLVRIDNEGMCDLPLILFAAEGIWEGYPCALSELEGHLNK